MDDVQVQGTCKAMEADSNASNSRGNRCFEEASSDPWLLAMSVLGRLLSQAPAHMVEGASDALHALLGSRSELITFAEDAIYRRPGTGRDTLGNALDRLGALAVAGMLATMDGPGSTPPFVHHELRRAYRNHQSAIAGGQPWVQ